MVAPWWASTWGVGGEIGEHTAGGRRARSAASTRPVCLRAHPGDAPQGLIGRTLFRMGRAWMRLFPCSSRRINHRTKRDGRTDPGHPSPQPAATGLGRLHAIGLQRACRRSPHRLERRKGRLGPSRRLESTERSGRLDLKRSRPHRASAWAGHQHQARSIGAGHSTARPARPGPIWLFRPGPCRVRSALSRPRPGVRSILPARHLWRHRRHGWCLARGSPSRRYPAGRSMDLARR